MKPKSNFPMKKSAVKGRHSCSCRNDALKPNRRVKGLTMPKLSRRVYIVQAVKKERVKMG